MKILVSAVIPSLPSRFFHRLPIEAAWHTTDTPTSVLRALKLVEPRHDGERDQHGHFIPGDVILTPESPASPGVPVQALPQRLDRRQTLAAYLRAQRIADVPAHVLDESPAGQRVVHDGARLEEKLQLIPLHVVPAKPGAQKRRRCGG